MDRGFHMWGSGSPLGGRIGRAKSEAAQQRLARRSGSTLLYEWRFSCSPAAAAGALLPAQRSGDEMLLLRLAVLFLLAAPIRAAALDSGADSTCAPSSSLETTPVDVSRSSFVGQRVRVRYEGRDHKRFLGFIPSPFARRFEVTGDLVVENVREIRVHPDAGDGGETVLATDQIISIDLSSGRRRSTATGLRTGALLGICITPFVWYGEGQGDEGVQWLETAAWTIGSGAAIGGLCGLLSHEDVWTRIERGPRISFAATPDGAAARIAVRRRF